MFYSIGKFAVVLPLASSISPKSGDTNLMSAIITSEDNSLENNLTLRRLFAGNQKYCFGVQADTGYDHEDQRAQDLIMLDDAVSQAGGLFMSTKVGKRILVRDDVTGLIRIIKKADLEDDLLDLYITRFLTIVKLVRICRHSNEQGHAGLKGIFKHLRRYKIAIQSLGPVSREKLQKFGLPERLEGTPR